MALKFKDQGLTIYRFGNTQGSLPGCPYNRALSIYFPIVIDEAEYGGIGRICASLLPAVKPQSSVE